MHVHINSLLLLNKNKWACFTVCVMRNLFAKLYECFYIAIAEKAGAMLLKAICCRSSTEEFRHLNLRFVHDSDGLRLTRAWPLEFANHSVTVIQTLIFSAYYVSHDSDIISLMGGLLSLA